MSHGVDVASVKANGRVSGLLRSFHPFLCVPLRNPEAGEIQPFPEKAISRIGHDGRDCLELYVRLPQDEF